MGLNSYTEQKRALQDAQQQKELDREAKERWSAHIFAQKKYQIIDFIRKAFASSNFDLQDDSEGNTLNFYNHQIDEKAKVTLRIFETIEAEIDINGATIGSIRISDAEGNGLFTFDPIGSNMTSLLEENSFELALDKLIDNAPELMFIED